MFKTILFIALLIAATAAAPPARVSCGAGRVVSNAVVCRIYKFTLTPRNAYCIRTVLPVVRCPR